MSKLICIRTYSDHTTAESAKNFLVIYGIEAILTSDDAGGLRPELTLARGVKLWVNEEDDVRARELLKSADIPESANPENKAEGEPQGFLSRLRKWLKG